jgi:hypothetical protein
LAFAQWYQFDKKGDARLSDFLHIKALTLYTIGEGEG